jgi:hypothetical protein
MARIKNRIDKDFDGAVSGSGDEGGGIEGVGGNDSVIELARVIGNRFMLYS